MSDLGFLALSLALAATTYSISGLVLGTARGLERLAGAGKRAIQASTVLLTLAVVALVYSLLARDFQVEYVASYTSRDLPLPYTLSALWAGQEGSLLAWTWILSIFATMAVVSESRRRSPLWPRVALVLACTQAFFLILLMVAANPFRRLDIVPSDGLGMNPLLQNPAMFWHPLLVYLGYVGFTVPFAFTMAALLSGRLHDLSLPTMRRWTLFPWLCLGLGTLLGARWAYVVLGWGGYWTWDPVENASLLPWLTSTALVHSLLFRGLKVKLSQVCLIAATFALCIFGAFLTRSGVVTSIHAFAVSTMGLYLLGFLGLVVLGSMALICKRLPDLTSRAGGEGLFSRTSGLKLTIALLATAAAAILIGTLFPLLSGATEVSLASNYFNVTSTTILGPLILLMGICPLVPWKGSTRLSLARQLLVPLVAALVTAASLLVLGLRDLPGVLVFSICALVVTTTLLQFYSRTKSRRSSQHTQVPSSTSGMDRPRRWYGGYVVHLGVVLITVGVVASSSHKLEDRVTLRRGASHTLGAYSLRYNEFSFRPAQGRDIASATLAVMEGSQDAGVLEPQRHFHHRAQQPVSEVAIRGTLKEELCVALVGWEDSGESIVLQVIVSPLIGWIWIGGAVVCVGAMLALWPGRGPDAVDQQIEEAIWRLRQRAGEGPEEVSSP